MMIKIAMAFKRIGKDKRGFTLVELMAVLAVLAIIAAIAVPRFTGTINTAKENADKASAQIIARAAEQKWIDDNEASKDNPVEGYTAEKLAEDGYLKEVPTPQNEDADDWYAAIDNGKCTAVYYGDDATGKKVIEF